MILFDFRCESCQNVYEQLLKTDSIPTCPACSSTVNQSKLISPPKVTRATSNDQPKTQSDLANYWGSGQYRPGYKPSWVP